ncbi:MAG: peptidase M64, partial [Acidobacteria bacterium]|nr:peptidase M64 [Acidobacteriota bacterium]
MLWFFAFALVALLLPARVQPIPTFDASFTGATMRVDYFHTGGPDAKETIALDRIVNDGDWPGSHTQLIDPTNLGKYRFEVR